MAVRKLQDEQGQMTVELCIVFPVAIVIAVIAVNALLFFSDCAVVDRAARNAACVLAASPSTQADASTLALLVASAVSEEVGTENIACTASSAEGGLLRFVVTYSFEPTLFGRGLRSSIWGVPLPKLTHTTQLVLDVYSPKAQVSSWSAS